MERRVIPGTIDTVFEFDYSVQAEDMRSLYEKAKRDQWNASRDIAWETPEPSDGRVLSDELVDIHGSKLWSSLSEKDRVELNRRIAAWRLSVLVYGEQGAMLACSQMVNIVTGTDEKFFQATQVMDEARHNEVLERYIQTRLGGLHYPMPDNERVLFDTILTDSRWYIKTIALQLVAETFAVAIFKMMQEAAADPLLRQVCARILQDESRHMGFGMLALPDIVREASDAERREMEDFTCVALEKVLTGFFPLEAYRDAGFTAGPDRGGQGVSPRRGGPQRLRDLPEVLQARHAHLDGEQPLPHRAPHRAGAAAPGRPRHRAARGRGLAAAEPLAQAAIAVVEEAAEPAASAERVDETPERARGQPVGHPVLHPGAGRPARLAVPALDEAVAVLPAREGPAELHVDEAVRPIELPDHHPPGDRQPPHAEVEHRARGEARRRREPARARPGGLDDREVARVREEVEHLGAGPRQPHATLEDMVRHDGRAIIGGCPAPVKRERTSHSR